jgi:ComF family protein
VSAGGVLEPLLELLFPPRCAACDQLGREPFCALCEETLEPAAPLSIAGVEVALARFEYGGAVALALAALKYQRRIDLGRPLARLLAAGPVPAHDLVVPVPLGPRRLRERGFNQARLLAQLLRPPWTRLLLRVKDAPAQVGADRAARAAQVRGAFVAPRPGRIAGRRVLLVDDVVTTGATAAAAAAALRAAGARSVALLALARAGS